MVYLPIFRFVFALFLAVSSSRIAEAANHGLVGYWKLAGDCRDYSDNGLDAVNHNVDLETGEFNGRNAYLEVPDSPKLKLGDGRFHDCRRGLHREKHRRCAGRPGEQVRSRGAARFQSDIHLQYVRLQFAKQHAQSVLWSRQRNDGKWTDCGRPGGLCHSSDALTVFNGDLYVGTVDAPDEADWAHVYRFKVGRIGKTAVASATGKARGVYAMIVHDGALYAATAGPHGGDKINKGDFGRVYRYHGGKEWEDIGQPGDHYRINSLASFNGKLYALSINTGGKNGGVYVYDGGQKWTQCGDFGRPHTSGVHDGRLYAAYPQGEVFAFDGKNWEHLGNPYRHV